MIVKTIAIFTTTRAEFGILAPLLEAIHGDNQLEFRLFHRTKGYFAPTSRFCKPHEFIEIVKD